MKVGIFLSTTSENKEKRKYLEAFGDGIKNKSQDRFFITTSTKYIECDLAVIFGFYGLSVGEVHKVRKNIYTEHTIKRKKNCVFIDADLFKFLGNQKPKENTHVRISYGSIFFDKALHFNENSNSRRWDLIKQEKEITLNPYRDNGEHILICLNSNPYVGKGWSAGNMDIYQWAEQTIKTIRSETNRPILLRFHPNAKEEEQKKIPIEKFITAASQDIKFSGGISLQNSLVINNTSLVNDCQNAWACIVYNTSASVTPIICGIPVFTELKNCPVYPIANHDLSKIENPILRSREQWLYDAAYSLWTYDEIKRGEVWKRFRTRINNRGEYSKSAAAKLGLI